MAGNPSIHTISTTDFFYPLVEDPYIQGRIACANTLSDVYAMGIGRVDFMLMILGVSREMSEDARHIVTREMMRGFDETAKEAGTLVTGGQSVMNPWPIIGGVATVTCNERDYIKATSGQVGDKLILTKPLGTQVAVNLNQWMAKMNENAHKSLELIGQEAAKDAYYLAMQSMATLNRNAAELMFKYKAHGATDVTGFGIEGHTANLAAVQKEAVDLHVEALPIINQMAAIDENVFDFRLLAGRSAETSGGLLIMMPPDNANDFMRELEQEYG